MWRIITLALFIFGNVVSSSAQGEQHDLKLANKEYNFENYIDALPYYIKLSESHPRLAEYYFKLGVCYFNVNSFSESLIALEKYKNLVEGDKIDKHFHFWYARALHLNDRFDEAIEEYTLYTFNNKSHHQISDYDNLYIEQVQVARRLESLPVVGITVRNLGKTVNSRYNEHNAIISNDWGRLYFTSNRSIDSVMSIHHHHPDRIFVSKRVNFGNWSPPELIKGALNEELNVSCVELIENDSKMLVHKDAHHGDLFISTKSDSGWLEPNPMNMINSWGVEDDAYISFDGRKIIFATDLHSENGDLDLYIVELKEDSTWSDPKSLGNVINSEFDEDSPFLSKDGKTLYFSSNGSNSMGGFDVFKSELSTDDSWGEPKNLGYPFNSSANDFNFYFDEERRVGLLSSQRAGGFGGMDVYVIELK